LEQLPYRTAQGKQLLSNLLSEKHIEFAEAYSIPGTHILGVNWLLIANWLAPSLQATRKHERPAAFQPGWLTLEHGAGAGGSSLQPRCSAT
jgi:hypothetical protein